MDSATLRDVAAVLSALGEMDDDLVPMSMLYLALGMDLNRTYAIAGLLSRAGLADTTPETIQITPKGKEMADRINQALVERRE